MIYRGNKLKEIVFPLGGIGTGSIGLSGNGALVDWEIFNRPNKGSLNGYSCFAVKAEYSDGRCVTKILQGDHTKELVGRFSKAESHYGYGYGPDGANMCGFPHFSKVTFNGKFPIAELTFEDDGFPAKVVMRAFNPFIPLDENNSSIPAAFFEIDIKSRVDGVKYTVVLSVGNPFESSENVMIEGCGHTAVRLVNHGCDKNAKEYGELTVATERDDRLCQEYWYRGGWKDKVTTFWRDLDDGNFANRHYDEPFNGDMCSVGDVEAVNKGCKHTFRFLISWSIPNNYNYWDPIKDDNGNDITWKNYYAVLFEDSIASAEYCFDNWTSLFKRTKRFCDSLHGSTLDNAVIDAVSSTLSVLKSPTVLRLEDGTFYGWEGVTELAGSCEGTCTHVWSYAYALCFLFPELERSLRDTEFKYDTTPDGLMHFRTSLPLGYRVVNTDPCLDGQMATVIKIYRDWKITANDSWLKDNWDNVKKILDYAHSESNPFEWDRNKDGVLEGRQHHTLDMELFGPSAWLEGMYLAALKASAEMAEYLCDHEKAKEYSELFEKGYSWTKDNLFNGKYFYHKVDLSHKDYTEHFECPQYWNEEKNQLKYQIADGCEIDQLLGQWHANISGLGDIFDKEQRKTALESMFKYNFKPKMRDFANMWRIFALNDEGGAVMCDYPQGSDKPIIPIPYCEECMTGFEYSFAGLLISEGYIDEGLTVIRAIRNRYDGEKRNPWNEIECGSNYARPMSSFALLPIFSGFEFDMPKKHIGFAPLLDGDFKCLWSLGCAWGDFMRNDNEFRIDIAAGKLELDSISLAHSAAVSCVYADGRAVDYKRDGDCFIFDTIIAEESIVFKLN